MARTCRSARSRTSMTCRPKREVGEHPVKGFLGVPQGITTTPAHKHVPGFQLPFAFGVRPLQVPEAHWFGCEHGWLLSPVPPRGMHCDVCEVPLPASQ
jgi:hypothetical protein